MAPLMQLALGLSAAFYITSYSYLSKYCVMHLRYKQLYFFHAWASISEKLWDVHTE